MKLSSIMKKAITSPFKLILTSQLFFSNNIINNCKQNKNLENQGKKLNSIMPSSQQGYAYGHYFPKKWSEQQIKKVLDPSLRDIQRVTIVKTSVGQHSGKVLIKFKNQKIRTKYIQKYNEDYIMTDVESQKVVILPFQLKTQEKKKQKLKGRNLKNGVRISNLQFDITQQQLRKIAAGYGEISYIQLNTRQSGINRGFATIYFDKNSDAHEFVNFINGFTYRDRKLKSYFIEKIQNKKKEKQFLQVPTFTFQANIQLMQRLRAKQYEHDQYRQK